MQIFRGPFSSCHVSFWEQPSPLHNTPLHTQLTVVKWLIVHHVHDWSLSCACKLKILARTERWSWLLWVGTVTLKGSSYKSHLHFSLSNQDVHRLLTFRCSVCVQIKVVFLWWPKSHLHLSTFHLWGDCNVFCTRHLCGFWSGIDRIRCPFLPNV